MKRRRSSTSSSSSSSGGDQQNAKESSSEQPQSKKTKTTGENNRSASKSQPAISVRLQNADMLTKYRNKNAHIAIETPKTKSNFISTEISDDDDIWLCEIPHSVDVNKILGKSVRLGNKRCSIKLSDETKLECVASEFDRKNGDVYANTVSVVFQNDDGKLSVRNLKASGRMSIHKKIVDDQRETVELEPTVRHECTIFPESLRVRHPLFGNHFENKIKLEKGVAENLAAATQAVDSTTCNGDEDGDGDGDGDADYIRIKQEKDDSSSANVTPKKSSKASKSVEKSISIKTEKNPTTRNGMDDDLARIKQIFQQC